MKKEQVFQRKLLQWFDRNKRSFPWRKTTNSYRILVSEIMLQQTQADRVANEYYDLFLKKFPTAQALAAAKQQEVLQAWSGLGYYRRAKNLHAAAKQIVKEHGGKVPKTKEELTQLPGVGPYTAGAVLAFAYNAPSVVLDTNVQKILQRVFFYKEPKKRKAFEQFAYGLVPKNKAREWYSALMDFGAIICNAKPKCHSCPVQKLCSAYPNILQEKKESKQNVRFTETNRWWRGKTLRVLTKEGPLTKAGLQARIKKAFGQEHGARLNQALTELRREGFVQYDSRRRTYQIA